MCGCPSCDAPHVLVVGKGCSYDVCAPLASLRCWSIASLRAHRPSSPCMCSSGSSMVHSCSLIYLGVAWPVSSLSIFSGRVCPIPVRLMSVWTACSSTRVMLTLFLSADCYPLETIQYCLFCDCHVCFYAPGGTCEADMPGLTKYSVKTATLRCCITAALVVSLSVSNMRVPGKNGVCLLNLSLPKGMQVTGACGMWPPVRAW